MTTVQLRAGWARTKLQLASGLVLDVGSGNHPNPSAHVLCERDLVRETKSAVIDERPMVVADGEALPFRDAAFELVLASHLLEHVEHPRLFAVEAARVGVRGYLETPSPLLEFLLPEVGHRWRVSFRGGLVLLRATNVDHTVDTWWRRRLYCVYYAGQNKDQPTFVGTTRVHRTVAAIMLLLRAVANRSGIATTRIRFSPEEPLRIEIR